MPGRLQHKVAVITGSSSGIGRATAIAFATEGAHIVCSDLTESFRPEYRTDASTLNTVQEIEKLGGKAIFVECNTARSWDIEKLIAKTVETYGRLDIMVNNAGMSIEGGTTHGPRPIWEFEEMAFERTFEVNVRGVFLGLKFATAQMIKQEPHANGDRGWIINLASVYGLGGGPGLSAYAASKHAVMGLTKVAAWDCAPHRIHVNAICPGYTQTSFIHGLLGEGSPEVAAQKAAVEAQHPLRGLGTPQDIARAAVFLASEDASWVTGIGLPVDGGYTSM
ncbi:short-chain dehydrogenase/reductase-like protein [Plenodomus tracheiphilus IPT5]|uniref:Short-chain dehydrogenase/reductase-like protein n=1 Tax=Plenodomus tracheiphilus IPT5 TaxID=1408161 RepID=A0A6A7B2D8_9PLEO|nr:short-chain dehydrogenase/reductase-like protein [Plenodomus tracheiphilus IPT5]